MKMMSPSLPSLSLQSFSGPYSMLHLMFLTPLTWKETDNPPALTIFHTNFFFKKYYFYNKIQQCQFNYLSEISFREKAWSISWIGTLFISSCSHSFHQQNNSLMGLQERFKQSDHCYLVNSIFTKDIFSSSYIWQHLFLQLWQLVKIILIHL